MPFQHKLLPKSLEKQLEEHVDNEYGHAIWSAIGDHSQYRSFLPHSLKGHSSPHLIDLVSEIFYDGFKQAERKRKLTCRILPKGGLKPLFSMSDGRLIPHFTLPGTHIWASDVKSILELYKKDRTLEEITFHARNILKDSIKKGYVAGLKYKIKTGEGSS